MSILDQIAGGNMQGLSTGLQIGQNIKDRQMANRLNEINTGIALEKLMAEKTANQQRAQGYNVIQQGLAPQAPASPMQPAPNLPLAPPSGAQVVTPPPEAVSGQPTPIQPGEGMTPQNAATEAPAGNMPSIATISAIPTDEIKRADSLRSMADQLMTNPQMQDQAKQFYALEEKAREHILKQTDEQRKESAQVSAVVGGMYEDVSRLEESGNLPAAQAKWDQVKFFLANDSKFKNYPEVQQFLKDHSQYQPGMGKLMYLSTMTGNKARDQLQAQSRITETERHDKAMEIKAASQEKRLSEKGTKGYKFTKSDRELELAQKIASKTATKEEKTEFDILTNISPIEQLKRKIIEQSAPTTSKSTGVDVSAIPPQSIEYLKNNPDQKDAFDSHYGEGAAEAVLGQ